MTEPFSPQGRCALGKSVRGKTVIGCGSRHWKNDKIIYDALVVMDAITEILVGDGRGADPIIKRAAEKLGIKVRTFEAHWEEHGDRAGPIRNALMFKENPDGVVAFHNNLAESRGTKDVINRARKLGLPCVIFQEGL